MSIRDELAEAEARVENLRRQIASASCADAGHDWRHIGGCNAGCGNECCCSVPVHECVKCRDCDYGLNAEATLTRKRCQEDR